MSRLVRTWERGGLLNDKRQRACIEDLKREHEADYHEITDRTDGGRVRVALYRYSDRTPVARAWVSLAGEPVVDVTEAIA